MMRKMLRLVVGGGGGRTIYAIPVLEYFEKHGLLKDLEAIAVTSAGGMSGLLLALGYTVDQMYGHLTKYGLHGKFNHHLNFVPEHVATHQPSPYITINEEDNQTIRFGKYVTNLYTYHYLVGKGFANVFSSEGIFDIQGLEESYWSILKECPHFNQFTDVEKRSLTFEQLHKLKLQYPEKKFVDIYFITVEEIKKKEYQVYVCSYKTTPSMQILQAAVASSHLPGFFRKRKYDDKILWDGSIKKNLARDLFDAPEYFYEKDRLTDMNMRTVAIYFANSKEEIAQKRDNITPTPGLLGQIFAYLDRLMVDSVIPMHEIALQDKEDQRDANALRTLYLNTSKVRRITPYLTEEDIEKIRAYAHQEAEQFVNNYFVNAIDPHISLYEIRQITNSTKLWKYFNPTQNDLSTYQVMCAKEQDNAGKLGKLPNDVIHNMISFSSLDSQRNLRESCRFFGFNANLKNGIDNNKFISSNQFKF